MNQSFENWSFQFRAVTQRSQQVHRAENYYDIFFSMPLYISYSHFLPSSIQIYICKKSLVSRNDGKE